MIGIVQDVGADPPVRGAVRAHPLGDAAEGEKMKDTPLRFLTTFLTDLPRTPRQENVFAMGQDTFDPGTDSAVTRLSLSLQRLKVKPGEKKFAGVTLVPLIRDGVPVIEIRPYETNMKSEIGRWPP